MKKLTPEQDKAMDAICEQHNEMLDRFKADENMGFENVPTCKNEKKRAQDMRSLLGSHAKSAVIPYSLAEQVIENMDETKFIYDHSPKKGGHPLHRTDALIEKLAPILFDTHKCAEAANAICLKLEKYGWLQSKKGRWKKDVVPVLKSKFRKIW